MKVLAVILVSLFALATCEIEEDEGVLVLKADNFDEAIAANQYIMVQFYAPWCGHCKSLAPEYVKVAAVLKEEGLEIRLAKIDVTEESSTGIAEQFSITGFPTLKFFKDGSPVDYQGGRLAADMLNYLKKKTGPPAPTLDDKDAAATFIEKAEVAVIGFFKDLESDAAKAFIETAFENDDLPFGITSNADVFSANKVDGDSVVLFKKFDEGRNDLTEDITPKVIKEFINANQLPTVVEFTKDTAKKIFGGTIKTHVILFISTTSDLFETTKEMFKQVAPQFKGMARFFYIGVDNDDNAKITDYFGLKKGDFPAVRYFNIENMTRYKPDTDELTIDSITSFVQAVHAGTQKPHLKTEEVPENWDASPVKVLVGKNFNEVAKDKSKDVFVEFYAPWCGHCKQLVPIWEELGERFKNDDSVVIAMMDATANEVEGLKVQGYPTLKFFPKDSDEIVDYNGGRTLDDFTKFVDLGGKIEEAETKEAEEEVKPEEDKEEEKKEEL